MAVLLIPIDFVGEMPEKLELNSTSHFHKNLFFGIEGKRSNPYFFLFCLVRIRCYHHHDQHHAGCCTIVSLSFPFSFDTTAPGCGNPPTTTTVLLVSAAEDVDIVVVVVSSSSFLVPFIWGYVDDDDRHTNRVVAITTFSIINIL